MGLGAKDAAWLVMPNDPAIGSTPKAAAGLTAEKSKDEGSR